MQSISVKRCEDLSILSYCFICKATSEAHKHRQIENSFAFDRIGRELSIKRGQKLNLTTRNTIQEARSRLSTDSNNPFVSFQPVQPK